ncbi:MAG: N-acetylmuramoyl-L-alanine amidase [Anaerolineales bacterium]|nr:MAG: N-acetylmuramoyl-L-alanine amidase [Anaerolineales bacterium]
MAIRNVTLNINEAVYEQALAKARTEGQTLSQILGELLTEWAGPLPEPPATPSPPPAEAAPAGVARTYTVKAGDTLGGIARDHYGSPAKYTLIAEANQITDPRRIWAGQLLTIPPLPETPGPPPPQAPVPPAPATTPTTVTPAPDAPPITWVGSPNFNRRPDRKDIWAIVIHATANGSLEGVINWFNNPQAQVSAHYTVGKDGRIAQHVHDEDRAWHAGKSSWKSKPNVNNYGLGIELVNLNDGQDAYPEEQHQANLQLCTYLCRKHLIKPEDIMGHLDIAVPAGRKTDPRGYDLERLRQEVTAALGT